MTSPATRRDDILSLGFIASPKHAALVEQSRPLADLDPAAYDAVFLVGGQAPMITFVDEPRVHELVRRFYEAGKVTAIVCHATSVLLKTTLSDGTLLVAGKTWTGFADSEEDFADEYVGQRIQPFRIEQEARKLEGTNFVVNSRFKPFAVRDGLPHHRAAAVFGRRRRKARHRSPRRLRRKSWQSTASSPPTRQAP